MRLILMATLIALSHMVSAQTIYKCVGPNGETQFSQRPCSDDAETVDVGPTNSSAPPSKAAANVFKKRERSRGEERYERSVQRRNNQRSTPNAGACQTAREILADTQESWRAVKRQGYTVDDQVYWEGMIRDDERYVASVCK